jgi:hypothetical protein
MEGCVPSKQVAKEVVGKMKKVRNFIHPARALKYDYDPTAFSRERETGFQEIYGSVCNSLLHHL